MRYQNPIIRGFNPDPSICYDGQAYYLVTSSFEYYPGLPLYRSTDLVNWEHVGNVLSDQKAVQLAGVKNSDGLFAPTIRYHHGTYYVVCTNVTQGNFIVHSTDPEHAWSEPVFVDAPAGIDPSLTFVADRCYLYLTFYQAEHEENEIDLFELNPDTGERLSAIKTISIGCGGRDGEGPHIYAVRNHFYLLMAEGGTREGHMVTMQRSSSIWGPYQAAPSNPILTNRNQSHNELQNVGHADLFQDAADHWWLVALAVRQTTEGGLLGRETILLPVQWTGDWPLVNGSGIATMIVTTNWLTKQQQLPMKTNQFLLTNIRTLGLPTPYQIDHHQVTLKNQASPVQVPVESPVAFISVSQAEYKFDFQATLNPAGIVAGEFGLMIYKDNRHLAKLQLLKTANQLQLAIKRQSLDIETQITANLPDSRQMVQFHITGQTDQYQLAITVQNQPVLTATMATRHFTSEVADSKFTGVQLGIYAHAETGVTRFEQVQLVYH